MGDHEMVKALHQEMATLYRVSGNADFQPDTRVYNELVASVAKGEDGATAAEAMLYEMIELSRNGIEKIKPNAVTFRNVINAFKGNYESGVAYKVEKLLELQEGLYDGSNSERIESRRPYIQCCYSSHGPNSQSRKGRHDSSALGNDECRPPTTRRRDPI
jgi:hypothetical protein